MNRRNLLKSFLAAPVAIPFLKAGIKPIKPEIVKKQTATAKSFPEIFREVMNKEIRKQYAMAV